MSTGSRFRQQGPGLFTITDLAMDLQDLGGFSGQQLTDFFRFDVTPANALLDATLYTGGYWSHGAASPYCTGSGTSGSRNIGFNWNGIGLTSVQVEHSDGNGTGTHTMSAVWHRFSSAQLGGTLTWPQRGNQVMLVGDRVMSNILPTGRFAVLTCAASLSAANAPRFGTASPCGIPAGSILTQGGSVNTNPVTYVLEFFDAICPA